VGLVAAMCAGSALLGAAVFTLLLISVLSLQNHDASARRASDLLMQSTLVERSVVDLETGLRGLLLTQEPAFLAPYTQARARLPGQLRALRLLAENQPERNHVDSITDAIDNYVADYAQPLISSGGHLTHTQLERVANEGKRRLDRLRTQFNALNGAEISLRNNGRRGVDSSSTAVAVAAGGLGVSVLLLVALGIFLVRGILRPVTLMAIAARRVAAGNLHTRVPEGGRGEVGILAGAFNEMAAQLQLRERELKATRDRLTVALEKAEMAATLKSDFLANMSHEIRTPLNGVIGMMDLISETHLEPEQQEYVSVARSSGEALMAVVNDVLDIAKIEAGRLELEHRYFDLHEVVESAVEMVVASSEAKGLEVQSFLHEDVPATVRGDRTRLSQILSNLLSNAVKFTAQGEVILEVEIDRSAESTLGRPAESTLDRPAESTQEDPYQRVCFAVRDTGIGIPRSKVEELFEPFAQGEAGTTRQYGGTGLGLAIVRELTQMMGGRIEVLSDLGVGSTFLLTLPLEVVAERRQPPSKTDLSGLRVLVVEDNATNRTVLETYANAWEMRAESADRADSALAKLRDAAAQGDPFQVALLDLHMPDRSGIELAREIAGTPELAMTRTILLTYSGEDLADYAAAGIRYVLTKPIRRSRLLDAIAAVTPAHLPAAGKAQAVTPSAAPADGATGEEADGESFDGGFRVLVAEDQAINWRVVERLLAKRGHSAVNAVNGRHALELLESEPFDLVLMDCQMPVVDGYQATRQLRLQEAEHGRAHTPVVAMTANAMEGDRERCLAAGMDDYLAKPVTSMAVDEVLARWLPRVGDAPAATIDSDRINELRTLFPGGETAEMFDQLQREVDLQLQRLADALGDGDGAEASEAAHRILSTARMVGAEALIELSSELQTRSREDLEAARGLAEELRAEWATVSSSLRAELHVRS
jgi:two-component system sensor histidine kinase/response regulator